MIPFTAGYLYSRGDIYEMVNVPEEQRRGNWDTGYNKFNGDWFIFCNIRTVARTGHKHKDEFIGDDLHWYGKTNSKLQNPSMQSMVHPDGNIYIFTREDSRNPLFVYRGNARVKEYQDTTPVKIVWRFDTAEENQGQVPPEEVTLGGLFEGITKTINVNVYERNPVARMKSIEHYGWSCLVCGYNFQHYFGKAGEEFIHVHHVVPLHTIISGYQVDPVMDLRPVCPNCHAIIHRREPPYSIEEMQNMRRK